MQERTPGVTVISLEVLAQDSAVVIKTNRELEITREKTKIKKKTVLSLCKSLRAHVLNLVY